MKSKKWKNDSSGEELDDSQYLMEYKEPGIVEVSNNRIYFYSDLDRDKSLLLTKVLKDKEEEMIKTKILWELDEAPIIHLHIQSDGGLVYSGFALYDHIKNMKVPVYTYVDGVCASAASLILLAGKKRFSYRHGVVLIHEAQIKLWGTARQAEIKDLEENNRKLMDRLKNLYIKETNMTDEFLDVLLKRDLYFDAEQQLEAKIIDEIIG